MINKYDENGLEGFDNYSKNEKSIFKIKVMI